MISIIAAMAKNRIIGTGGALPWKLPADMKRFKQLTSGHPIIMGRKTFESIGKALPNRANIVVTRQKGYSASGCHVFPSLEEAVLGAGTFPGSDEIFVIGGGEIYKQAIEIAHKIYLTFLNQDFEGDAYFPEIDEKKWKLISRESGKLDAENIYPHSFLLFERAKQIGKLV